MAYDPRWPLRFEAEARRLREALGGLARRLDHVGSTAVPGLGGRAIIDIQISVLRLDDVESYRRPLRLVGYRHRTSTGAGERYPSFHHPPDWPSDFAVHVCRVGSEEERRHLAFRDYLREHREVAHAYEREKRRLAERFAEDPDGYDRAKGAFIGPVEREALTEGYPHGLPRDPSEPWIEPPPLD
jgi:GrpB-like predicted nucleotidyltransferase (UPF0157 family)